MRFRLSTLIVAVTLFAIVWAVSALPPVETEEFISYLNPNGPTLIPATTRPPTGGEIAGRAMLAAVPVFGGWAGIHYLQRRRGPGA